MAITSKKTKGNSVVFDVILVGIVVLFVIWVYVLEEDE